jgi:hypothetical protein
MADFEAAGLAAVADAPVVDTTPEVDAPVTDAGDEGGSDTDGLEPVTGNELGGEDGDEEPVEAPVKNDGRTLPADLKASLAELNKTNPKMADQISKDFFKVRQIEAMGFKSTADVKALKDTIDNIVGLNGETGVAAIEALQADAQEFNDEITAFAQGDPGLLQKLATQSPEGFMKLIPHAIKLFREKNAEGYSKMMDAEIDTVFTQNNVYPHVQSLLAAIGSDEPGARAEALRLGKALQGWLAGKQGKGNAPVDKDRESLNADRQAWETQKATEAQQKFEKEMYGGLNPVVTNKVNSILSSLLPKGYKLPEATQARILQTIFSQIDSKLMEKEDYKTRAEAIFKTKDLKRVHNFMVSRIEPLLLPLTKAVYTEFRGVVPAKKAAVAPRTQGNQQAPVKGAQPRKPSYDEAKALGFSKEEWLNSLGKKKLERAGKTYFAW